jgi:hypothetical protein
MFDTLSINWPYFLIAVALLWFPRQWLRTGKRVLKRRRKPDGALEQLAGMGARTPEDRSVHPGKEFSNFRNYVDLVRALAGTYCLREFGLLASSEQGRQMAFWVIATILLIGVLIQSVRHSGTLSFFAAIFYMVGLSVGSSAHYASLFAFALVLAINPIIANARLFLTAYGLIYLIIGLIFGNDWGILGLNVFLFLLVPLASLLMNRPVVIFSRKSKRASA